MATQKQLEALKKGREKMAKERTKAKKTVKKEIAKTKKTIKKATSKAIAKTRKTIAKNTTKILNSTTKRLKSKGLAGTSFDFSKYKTEALLKMYFDHPETARSEFYEDTLVITAPMAHRRNAAIKGLKKIWGQNMQKANFNPEYYL